ncbi:hypothetical protein HK103_004885 [Boothiomyces macroporosus]|uniref:Uncharacterized protein n=1 Tax=Boothiomyces macroporosus TaxID=261099 RepID=A0AAD5UIV3_9FUNG|nr:hypothetical protein HK103_004885 [Boothiomyces macroporosus]
MDAQDHKVLNNLYKLGQRCLDTLGTLVEESELEELKSPTELQSPTELKTPTELKSPSELKASFFSKVPGTATPPGKQKKSTKINSVETYTPLLAVLSNTIMLFFETIPSELPTIATDMVFETPKYYRVPYEQFQLMCSDFLLNSKLNTKTLADEQLKLWERILKIMNVISGRNTKKSMTLELEALDQIMAATERLWTTSPRYISQTSEMSSRKQLELSKAQILGFIDRLIAGNASYQDQRAVKRENDIEKTMELIWKMSSSKMTDQCVEVGPSTTHFQSKILGNVIAKQVKHRLTEQEWKSPQIIMNEQAATIHEKLDRVEGQMNNQRYETSEEKQRSMFFGRMQGHLERMGGRMPMQDALSKEEMKQIHFKEVDVILDAFQPRYDSQTASYSKRHSVTSPPLNVPMLSLPPSKSSNFPLKADAVSPTETVQLEGKTFAKTASTNAARDAMTPDTILQKPQLETAIVETSQSNEPSPVVVDQPLLYLGKDVHSKPTIKHGEGGQFAIGRAQTTGGANLRKKEKGEPFSKDQKDKFFKELEKSLDQAPGRIDSQSAVMKPVSENSPIKKSESSQFVRRGSLTVGAKAGVSKSESADLLKQKAQKEKDFKDMENVLDAFAPKYASQSAQFKTPQMTSNSSVAQTATENSSNYASREAIPPARSRRLSVQDVLHQYNPFGDKPKAQDPTEREKDFKEIEQVLDAFSPKYDQQAASLKPSSQGLESSTSSVGKDSTHLLIAENNNRQRRRSVVETLSSLNPFTEKSSKGASDQLKHSSTLEKLMTFTSPKADRKKDPSIAMRISATKRETEFSELEKVLDNVKPKYDGQTAQAHDSPKVRARSNSERRSDVQPGRLTQSGLAPLDPKERELEFAELENTLDSIKMKYENQFASPSPRLKRLSVNPSVPMIVDQNENSPSIDKVVEKNENRYVVAAGEKEKQGKESPKSSILDRKFSKKKQFVQAEAILH